MIPFPDFDPVIFSLGPLKLRWYGLMYLIGFALAWWLARVRAQRADINWSRDQVGDVIFYGAIGVILGGRLGYILFYKFNEVLVNPTVIFRVWEGGMSFHGGLIGVGIALWLFARRYKKPVFEVTDFIIPMVPLGLGFGRVGNFINNELWGKPSDLPWAVIPPDQVQALHPSQLYEAFLEGLVLFVILWIYSSRPRPVMSISALFLILYGCFRFIVEFVRSPDADIGYLAFDWLTMGQVLSLPMIILGLIMFVVAQKKQQVDS